MSQASDTPLIPSADPPLPDDVGAERSRFLRTARGCVSGQVLAEYAEVLDTFIRWSLSRPDLAHVRHAGSQDVFKFELAGIGQVFWAAYPRERDGAKFSVLPKESIEVPEAIRAEVRRRFAEIDGGTENSGPSIPTLPFPLLFAQTARQRVLEALSSALEAIGAGGGGRASQGTSPAQ